MHKGKKLRPEFWAHFGEKKHYETEQRRQLQSHHYRDCDHSLKLTTSTASAKNNIRWARSPFSSNSFVDTVSAHVHIFAGPREEYPACIVTTACSTLPFLEVSWVYQLLSLAYAWCIDTCFTLHFRTDREAAADVKLPSTNIPLMVKPSAPSSSLLSCPRSKCISDTTFGIQ